MRTGDEGTGSRSRQHCQGSQRASSRGGPCAGRGSGGEQGCGGGGAANSERLRSRAPQGLGLPAQRAGRCAQAWRVSAAPLRWRRSTSRPRGAQQPTWPTPTCAIPPLNVSRTAPGAVHTPKRVCCAASGPGSDWTHPSRAMRGYAQRLPPRQGLGRAAGRRKGGAGGAGHGGDVCACV